MPKRVLIGTVVSDKADKTVTVRVDRRVKHPLYGKIIRRSKKYHAHDADNAFRIGEQVRIEECKPISKSKTWTVLERIGVAKAAAVEINEPEVLASEMEPTAEAKADKAQAEKAEKPAKAEKAVEKTEKKPAKPSKGNGKAKTEDVADADA